MTKLFADYSGSAYEAEADRVADSVISDQGGENAAGMHIGSVNSSLGQGIPVNAGFMDNLDGGQELEAETKNHMETRFGSPFDAVRIHTGSDAGSLADSINAKAFTSNTDIVFGPGQYSPDSEDGKRLIAHELTHVVQQGLSGTTEILQRDEGENKGPGMEQAQLTDISDWVLSKENTLLYFFDGVDHYFLPANGIVYQMPVKEKAEGPVIGLPAVGAGGSQVVNTGSGKAIMFDAGSGRRGITETIFLSQLSRLLGRIEVNQITGLKLIHPNHVDHAQRIAAVVKQQRIPASRLKVSPYHFPNAPEVQKQIETLGKDPDCKGLGYESFSPDPSIGKIREGASVYRVRFQEGEMIFEYYANPEMLKEVSKKTESGKVESELADSASFLVTMRKAGSGFRMVILGDLRGSDYLELKQKMDAKEAGAFQRLFNNVEILSGFQHHLGIVRDSNDVAGIGALLDSTVLVKGRLSVVVQSDDTQMRPKLAEALGYLGVDVHVAKTGTQVNESNIVVNSDNSISMTGPNIQTFKAEGDSAAVAARVAQIRQRTNALRLFSGELFPEGKDAKKSVEILKELEATEREINELYAKRQEMTVGRLKGLKRVEADKVSFDTKALEDNAKEILKTRDIDTKLKAEELTETLDNFNMMSRNAMELDRQISLAARSGEASPRLLELIQQVNPKLAKEIIGDSPITGKRRMRRVKRQLLWQIHTQNLLQRTSPVPLKGRIGAGAMLAITVGTDIVLPLLEQKKKSQHANEREAVEIIEWWMEKLCTPKMMGVIKNTISEDDTFEDQSTVGDKLKEKKLDAVIPISIPDQQMLSFTLWISGKINNANDFANYFVDDKTDAIRRVEDGGRNKWQMKMAKWDPGFFGGLEFVWDDSEKLTTIMNATHNRVVTNTEKELKTIWDERKPADYEQPPSLWAEGSRRPPTEIYPNPIRKVKFKSGAEDQKCYSEYEQHKIMDKDDWWMEPNFYQVKADNLPDGYIAVMGADYNTFMKLRASATCVFSTRPRVYIPKRNYPLYEVLARDPDYTEEQKAAMRDPSGVFEKIEHDSTYRGYIHFPGWIQNQSAYALIKEEDVE